MKTQHQSCSLSCIQWNAHSEFSHQGLGEFLWYLTHIISDKHLAFNKEHFCCTCAFPYGLAPFKKCPGNVSWEVLLKLTLSERKHGEKRNCMDNIMFLRRLWIPSGTCPYNTLKSCSSSCIVVGTQTYTLPKVSM